MRSDTFAAPWPCWSRRSVGLACTMKSARPRSPETRAIQGPFATTPGPFPRHPDRRDNAHLGLVEWMHGHPHRLGLGSP